MSVNQNVTHLDAEGSVFFTRQLEYVKGKIIEEQLVPLTYAQFIPVSAEMPLGATNFTWRSYSGYGQARIISDYAKDFPRSEIAGKEQSITVKNLGASYAYTIMDIRRAQYGGVDLEYRKGVAARRAIEEKINSIAWKGDATFGIQGFLNYPGVVSFTPAGATAGDKLWSAKTADQIIDDLNAILAGVDVATNGIETPNTILIPKAQMTRIKNLRSGTNSDLTVYEWFIRNNPGITLEVCRELKGAGAGGTDMIVAYTKSSDKLEFQLPMALETLEMQKDGLEYIVPMMATVAGVVVYYPLSISQGSGV
jgi:hypothetical protein